MLFHGPRTLSIDLRAGLCNRLVSLTSAVAVCRSDARSLRVRWALDAHCGAEFGDLFENRFDSAELDPDATATEWGMAIPLSPKDVSLWSYWWPTSSSGGVWREVDDRERDGLFSELVPTASVRELVAARSPGPGAVGVHVRRGDFGPHLKRWYGSELPTLDAYAEAVESCGSGPIYLATDGGPEVSDWFRDRFGDAVSCYGTGRRDSEDAIRDALADLLILRSCDRLVGTRGSSFTAMAGLCRRVTLV